MSTTTKEEFREAVEELLDIVREGNWPKTEPVGSALKHVLRLGEAMDDVPNRHVARELREADWFCDRVFATPGLVEPNTAADDLLQALAVVAVVGLNWWRESHSVGTNLYGCEVTLQSLGGEMALLANQLS